MSYYDITLDDIVKKNPFIYELDGNLYAIGQGIFQLIGPERITLPGKFNTYKAAIGDDDSDNIENGTVALESNLKDVFYSLMARAKMGRDAYQSDADVLEKVHKLSDSDKDSLLKQLKCFVAVYRYFYA